MVYGGRTEINGVLNAYANGHIGGNVAFADPYGLVVGRSGVVNVGSLSVSTPTKDFMNRMLGAGGQINDAAVSQFLAGEAPLSADGSVDIEGRINAAGGIRLQAAQVVEAATGKLSAGRAEQARGALFRATVNTEGLQQGTRAVAHNGVISIEGQQSATLAGQVRAQARDGGEIAVTGRRVALGPTAQLDSSGAQGGGQILAGGGPHGDGTIASAQNTTVDAGARLHASATADGNGGNVVVWSDQGTDFAGSIAARGGPLGGDGGSVEVSARHGLDFHGRVDTRAPKGLTGSLLLDPDNLYIISSGTTTAGTSTDSSGKQVGDFTTSSPASDSYVTVTTLQGLGDTNITLQAFNQITVGTSGGGSTDLNLSGQLTDGQTLTLEAGASANGATGLGDIIFNSGSSIKTGGADVVLDAGAGFSGAAGTDATAILGSITTAGGKLTVNAGSTITLPASATLDTTLTNGTAGDVELSAVQEVSNSPSSWFDPGTFYNSTDLTTVDVGNPTAAANVSILGTIDGGAVSIDAKAAAAASFNKNVAQSVTASALYQKLGLSGSPLLQATYYHSDATATVTLGKTASVSGSKVTVDAEAAPTVTVKPELLSQFSKTVANATTAQYLAAIAGEVSGKAAATIDSGAKVDSTGDLSVTATGKPNLKLKAQTANDSTGPAVTISYGHADFQTNASIQSGADITAEALDLSAANEQSFIVSAKADSGTSGSTAGNAGIAGAISLLNTSAQATEAAKLGDIGNVTVTARSATDDNETNAETGASAGGENVTPPTSTYDNRSGFLQNLAQDSMSSVNDKTSSDVNTSDNSAPTGSSKSTTTFNLGSAFSLALGTQSAKANVADNTTIDSHGDVVVRSYLEDPGMHNGAVSEVSSTEPSATNTGGTTETGVSLAVALGWQTHTSQAWIGQGADVTANHIGVQAVNEVPLSFLHPYVLTWQYLQNFKSSSDWKLLDAVQQTAVSDFLSSFDTLAPSGQVSSANWSDPSKLVSAIKAIAVTLGPDAETALNAILSLNNSDSVKALTLYNKIKESLGPGGTTSFAKAAAETSKLGLAGAVNYLSLTNQADAWVAPGAKLTLAGTQPLAQQDWTSTIESEKVDWAAPITVQAENASVTWNGAGNGFLNPFGLSSEGSGNAVGGAFDWTDFGNAAQAWVADGATLTTNGNDVSVSAGNADHLFTFVPSGGKGGGYAGNGAFAVSRVADQTTAEIDNQANIVAGDGAVNITALTDVESFSLAGAVVSSGNAGVGIGVAVNLVDPTTTAGITGTSSLTTGPGDGTAGNANDCTGGNSGPCVSAGDLSVLAQTTAAVGTLGLAGAASGSSSEEGGGSSSESLGGNIKNETGNLQSNDVSKSSDNTDAGGNQGVTNGQNETSSSATNAKSELSDANNNTGSQDQAKGNVQSDFKDNSKVGSEAGGSSKETGTQKSELSLAIAGSAAVSDAQMTTKAVLDNADIELGGSSGASVQAVRDDSVFAAAGAAALSRMKEGSSGKSVAIAGTLGLNLLNADTEADVTGTTLTLDDSAAGLGVQALAGGQAVAVGLGLAVNTQAGEQALASVVGSGSVTVGRDQTQALLSGSTVQNTATAATGEAQVLAYDATDIGTGGGAFYSGGTAGIGIALSLAMTGDDTRAEVIGGSLSGFSSLDVEAFSPAQIVSAAAVGGWGGSTQELNLAGAVVVDQIANSTTAEICGDSQCDSLGAQAKVTVGSGVTVHATTQDNSSLQAQLPGAYSLPFDFTGSALPGLEHSMGGASDQGQSSPTFQTAGTSNAVPGASVISVAGSASLGKGEASLGISAVYGGIDNNTEARVADAALAVGTDSAAGAVDVAADDQSRIISVAVGLGATSGEFAGTGSFTVNNLGGSTSALIGDGSATSDSTSVQGSASGPGPAVTVQATDGHTVWSAAGGFAGSSETAAGAALAVNVNQQHTTAKVEHARLDAGAATVEATSTTGLYSGAIAAGFSGEVAVGGSLDLTVDLGSTTAGIANSDLNLSGTLKDQATDSGSIWDGAGGLAGSGETAVGIALAINVALHQVDSNLTDSTLSAAGQDATVSAGRSGFIASGAVGGAGSGETAGGLAVVANVANDKVQAKASGVTGGQDTNGNTVAAGLAGLTVSATDSAQVYALGGELAGSGEGAGGGAVVVTWLGQTVSAALDNSTLAPTGPVDVTATGNGEVGSLSAVIAGSGEVALGGALGVNITNSDVSASASGDTLAQTTSPDVTIAATDQPSIKSLALGVAGSGEAAAGVGIAVNRLGDTTSASIEGGNLHANDLTVKADSSRGISTLAAGVAVAGEASAAGSLVTDVLSGTTSAYISGGAQVVADNNAGVLASDQNTISASTGALAVGGAAAGIGLGVTVNVLGDNTNAYIGPAIDSGGSADGTAVSALAQGTDGMSVDSGQLSSTPDVQSIKSYDTYLGPQLQETQTTVHGLAVDAQSLNAVTGLSASASMSFDPEGSGALDASVVTNVLGGKTLAYSNGATLDGAAGGTGAQAVSVIAGRHDFAGDLVFGAAGGTNDVSASAAIGVNSFDSTTRAFLQGGTVSPAGQVDVLAYGSQDSFGLGAGLSAAIVGAAGTAMVDVFNATTDAYAQGGTIDAQGLSVQAQGRSSMSLVSGSGAVGGAAAAATFLVVAGEDSTKAWVGDSSGKTATTVTLTGGDLDIEATSQNTLWTLAISGALAGGPAYAGQASALVMSSDTEANLYDATATGVHDATVQAQDTTDVKTYAGALSAGTADGTGEGASIAVLHQTVAAGIAGSSLTAGNEVDVKAISNKSVQLVSATAGIGFSGGIGGAAGLILLGSGDSGDAMQALNKNGAGTLSSEGSLSQSGNSSGADSSLSSSEQTQVGQATSFDLVGSVNGPVKDATTATISGGSVKAATLKVTASDTTSTQNIAGAAGLSAGLGVGAAIAVTRLYDTVGASLDGTDVTAGSVTVSAGAQDGSAYAGHAVDVAAYAGGAGLALGLGAAIADGEADNTVSASVSGGSLNGDGSGSASVSASGGESVNVQGIGASAGAASVGLVSATALKQSQVSADLGSSVDDYRQVGLGATGSGGETAQAIGASAGIFSGNGAVAVAHDASNVAAGASSGPAIVTNLGSGGFDISASSSPVVSAKAIGVSVGAASLGASVSTATADGSVEAKLADGSQVSGTGGLSVSAQGSPTLSSEADAGTGGLIGAQAVVSTATNNLQVTAETGSNVLLPDGDVLVSAGQDGAVTSTGTGVVVGGLAAGAVLIYANANPDVTATLGSGASSGSSRSGQLSIEANGNDTLRAQSTSGAGGLGAGNAAKAETNLNATTVAQTEATNGTVYAGQFQLTAQHDSNVSSQANSTNVSVAGGGAALAQNDVTSTVRAEYGAGTDIQASTAQVTAENDFTQPTAAGGWDAQGAAGGGINYNQVSAVTNLTFTTDALIDGGSILTVVGSPTEPQSHQIVVGTDVSVNAQVGSKVATGGIGQGLTSDASFNGTSNSSVDIASGAALNSSGNIDVYSGAGGSVSTNALAHTWGGAGVVNSSANASLTANQDITVAGNLQSLDDVFIGAGYNGSQGTNNLSVNAQSHAYNYTVLAVGTNPSASATQSESNSVSVPGQILAGGNAQLLAAAGQHGASALAIGKNSYQEVVQKIVNFFIGLINHIVHKQVIKPVTLEYRAGTSSNSAADGVNVSGTVEAGVAGSQKLVLSQNTQGGIVASPDSSPLLSYDLTTWNYYQYLEDEKQNLQDQLASTSDSQTQGRLAFQMQAINAQIALLQDANGNPLPSAENVPLVTVNPVLVRAGNVIIGADPSRTHIGGTVKAFGVKGVTIDNTAPAFLQVGNITVQGGGGKVEVNGQVVSSAPDTANPTVSIDSSYTPPTNSSEIAPDIFLDGEIYNPLGDVVVQDSAGSIHQQGTINGGSVSLAALNGGYFQGYQSGYHTPGNVTPINKTASVIAGGPVYIAAAYLNVDGLIQSGHDHFAVTLPQSLDSELQNWLAAYGKGTASWQQYIKNNNLPYDQTTGYVQLTPDASINNPDIIPAFWDPATNRIVLNGAISQPGRVYLYGSIFNTSSSSSIVAASGLANISVDNQTNLPVVVQGLNAGSADAGGLVQITDTAKTVQAPGKNGKSEDWSQVTEYRFDPQSGQMSLYQYAAGAPGQAGAADSSTLVGTTSTSSDSYQIADNGGGVWYVTQPVTLTQGGASYTLPQGLYRPKSPKFSVAVPSSTTTYTIKYFGLTFTNVPATSSLRLFCFAPFCSAAASNNSSSVTIQTPWSSILHAVDAGYSIGISFIGKSQGNISVTSPAGIWLDGSVSDSTGPVTLSAANGIIGASSSAAAVTGTNVSLSAGQGIGSGTLPGTGSPMDSRPVGVALIGQGVLSATSTQGDVALNDSLGELRVSQVSAPAGSVSLSSAGGIVATGTVDPAILSQGDMSLTSSEGSVHGPAGAGDPLHISVGGVLNVDAPFGTVDLTQAAVEGDLSVGQITAGGDVTLSAPGGSIVSALAQTTNQKSLKQLQQQWNSFGLTGSAAQQEGQQNLTHIENDFKVAYQQYWSIKNNVVLSGSGSSLGISGLTTAGYATYKAAAAAYNGIPVGQVTDAQTLAYVQGTIGSSLISRYQSASSELGQLTQGYGFTSGQVDPYLSTEQDSAFASTLANGLASTVTQGVSWTEDQLLNTASQQAVLGTSAALHTQAPNITTPGTVTLLAGSSGARLGDFAAPVTIQLPATDSGTLTLDSLQEAALAAAAPGDITTQNTAIGPLLTVTVHHPVYLQGAGVVDAQAPNGVFLSSGSGDLVAGTVISPQGQIRLNAGDNLVEAASGAGLNGAPGGVVLNAVNGAIGSAQRPLPLNTSGPLNQAKANGDVYVEQTTGDLALGNFYSGATGSITVDHGALTSIFSDASVAHVQARHLILNTPDAVGAGVPLAVTLGSGGLSGQVGGALSIVSPSADLDVHGLTVTGPVTLAASLGGLGLDGLASGAGQGAAITLSAGTFIQGLSSEGADISAPSAGAALALTAGTGIGTAQRSLVVDVPVLTSAYTETGGIYLTDMQGLSAGSVNAAAGPVGLLVHGDLSFDSLLADTDLAFAADGAVQGGHAAAVSGALDGTAGGDMEIGSVGAGQSAQLTAPEGSIGLGTLATPQARLGARDSIDVQDATILDLIQFYAAQIQGRLTQPAQGQGPLTVGIQGWQGGNASQANLEVDAPNGVNYVPLNVDNATLRFDHPNFSVSNAYVAGVATFISPESTVLVDNLDTTVQNADVQLYQPNQSFFLVQQGTSTYTNAFTVHVANGFQVRVPDYLSSHQDTTVVYGGGSAYVSGAVATFQTNRLLKELPPQLSLILQAAGQGFHSVVESGVGGSVNLGGNSSTGPNDGRGTR